MLLRRKPLISVLGVLACLMAISIRLPLSTASKGDNEDGSIHSISEHFSEAKDAGESTSESAQYSSEEAPEEVEGGVASGKARGKARKIIPDKIRAVKTAVSESHEGESSVPLETIVERLEELERRVQEEEEDDEEREDPGFSLDSLDDDNKSMLEMYVHM
jgi:hypothetical protein